MHFFAFIIFMNHPFTFDPQEWVYNQDSLEQMVVFFFIWNYDSMV